MRLREDLKSIPRRINARRARRAVAKAATDEDHQRVLRAVVDEIAADVLASGAAELKVEPPPPLGWSGETLILEPRNPAAARVELGAAIDATYVIVGDPGVQAELWDPLPEARGRLLRTYLEAVFAGRVEATIEPRSWGTREELVFHIEPEARTIRRTLGEDEPRVRRHETYEPY